MTKTWFITGASKGLGRAFATAALKRGDRVAATGRDTSTLQDLAGRFGEDVLPLQLDVTDRQGARSAVERAHQRFGRLDVVVNNAGYGHFGAVEELTETELRDQLDTNLFGALRVTQAALPILRKQGGGHLVQISSIGGIGAFPNLGAYHASKWALEALSESLALEVAPLGIRVTLVEPGGYGTDWAGPSSTRLQPLPAYDFVRDAAASRRTANPAGDPTAAAQALLEVADADAPPLRILFGAAAPTIVKGIYQARLQTWQNWDALTQRAQG